MAKLSELSDQQLEKAFAKYQAQFKESQNDKLRNILKQIRTEQQKRGNTGGGAKTKKASSAKTSATKTSSAKAKAKPASKKQSSLADLAAAADQSVRKKSVKKKNKFTQKEGGIKKARISPLVANIMLGSGLLLGLIAMFLLFDYFFLEWIDMSTGAMIGSIVMLALGIGLGMVANNLSDDDT